MLQGLRHWVDGLFRRGGYAATVALLCVSGVARSQGPCDSVWRTGPDVPTVNGLIDAMVRWDPDGNGPLPEALVISGAFTSVGGAPAARVAIWNGQQWVALGSGLNGEVFSLEVFEGDLIAGGSFTASGATSASSVARWNGTEWSAMGSGPSMTVKSLHVHDGVLYAGGVGSGGSVKAWNGNTWVSVGAADREVRCVYSFQGELVAGGLFSTIGGTAASLCAAWNGSSWRALGATGTGPNGFDVNAMTIHNGDLIAVGSFTLPGGASKDVVRWNGTQWLSFGAGASSIVKTAHSFDGQLYIAGVFTSVNSVPAQWVARWNGAAWSPLGSGLSGSPWVLTSIDFDGDMVFGGGISLAGGHSVQNFARWGSPCRCPADLDNDGNFSNGGTRDNAVDINDLLFFLTSFEAGDASADLDDDGDPALGSPDGGVDVNDLLFFLSRFELGC